MMTNHGNRLTQGQFSYLPDLTDAQIGKQIEYALRHHYAVGIEYTDDPMFDLKDPAGILSEINACRKTFPQHYVRVTAFDSTQGVESPRMSFIVNRPTKEPGFGLARQEGEGRQVHYRISSYATDKPEGERYGAG